MGEERAQRHLAAIFAADVVGYSRLIERDEADTFARLRAHRKELFEPEIAKHHGRIFKLMGDGLLAEFGSVVDAVECAVVLQRAMDERNDSVPEDRRIDVRIGINLGDVIVEGEDRHGEGVVIAARLQELAAPGGIAISRQAHDQVEAKLDLAFDDLGKHPVKNIAKPVHVYRVREGAARAPRRRYRRRLSTPYAVIALTVLVAVAVLYLWPPQPAPAPGPRIVVLPFSVTGGEPCNPALSEGLARDIGAALLMFGYVSVISDAREYGYKLDGSIECSADGLRVAAQLFDANGNEVASEVQNSSRSVANVSKARMELAGRLAGGIASPTTPLWRSEEEKTNAELDRNPTDELRSYRCVLLSYAYYNTFSAKAHREARDCLEGAVNTVKNNAVACARLGAMYFEEHKYGHNPRPGGNPLRDARSAAQGAIEINSQLSDGYYILALVYYYTEKDFESFHEMAKKAIEKNPYNGWIIGDLGVWTYYSGDWERGKALIETARAIYPDDPRWLDFPDVLDHYRKGEYREAKAAAHALELSQNAMVQEVLAATYAQLGEIESAKKKVDEILVSHPELEANPRAPFLARKIPADLIGAIMDGLQKAGFNVRPAGEPPSK